MQLYHHITNSLKTKTKQETTKMDSYALSYIYIVSTIDVLVKDNETAAKPESSFSDGCAEKGVLP